MKSVNFEGLVINASEQARLYREAIENHNHRLIVSAHQRGYSNEEIAGFLDISVELVEEYALLDPDSVGFHSCNSEF